MKTPISAFYGGSKQATTKFSFYFCTWIWSLGIQLQEGSPTFDKVGWVGIIAIKTETTQIHFLSGTSLWILKSLFRQSCPFRWLLLECRYFYHILKYNQMTAGKHISSDHTQDCSSPCHIKTLCYKYLIYQKGRARSRKEASYKIRKHQNQLQHDRTCLGS